MPESFDSYSNSYNELLNDAIHQTGYVADNLVSAKLQKLRNLFPDLSESSFRLMDFGCGIGNLFGKIYEFFPNAVYTGVDSSKDCILKARSRFPENSDFQEYDSSVWKNQKYDLIFSAGVFHHIPQNEHGIIFDKLSSFLNEGGRLVIWEHNPINPVTQKIVKDCPFDDEAVLVPPRKIKKHFNRVFLTNVEIIYTTFFPKFLSGLNFMDPYLGWLPLGGQYLVKGEKR